MSGSTSTQRTHRYLRIAIGGTVVVIFAAVLTAVPTVGWLTAISDYYYTPARNAFVGALVAASLALLALSGRGAERAILDAAALFAPLIALVPTVIRSGTVPGLDVACAQCVPPAAQPDVANGVTTYLIVLAGILALGVVLSLAGAVRGARFSLILGAGVFSIVLIVGLAAPELLLGWTHLVATVAFFALMAADAIYNAFWRTTSRLPPTWLRIIYIVIAIILIVDLIVLVAATLLTWDAVGRVFPWILVGEAIALLAFLAFWWLQTWQRWDETDPASLVPLGDRLPPLRVEAHRSVDHVTGMSLRRMIFRWLLGAGLLFTGVGHLTFARESFVAQVPAWLPLPVDLVVVASGVVEITLGLALIVLTRQRVVVGWITAAFFIAIFPGNVEQFVSGTDAFGLDTDLARGIRLLFQPLLVIWALWSTGAWKAWRARPAGMPVAISESDVHRH